MKPRLWSDDVETLESAHVFHRGHNAFGLMRLVLASLVIVSHTWAIGGFGTEPLSARHNRNLGFIAVAGFFALSGALVARSAERASNWGYLWNRIRRIFPAYWACLAVSAFVIGPLIAIVRGLPISAVSHPPQLGPYNYVLNNYTLNIGQYPLGRILRGLPYPQALNGSIWSLTYEFTCYLVILVLVRLAVASKRPGLVLGLALALSIPLSIFVAHATAPAAIVLPVLGNLDAELFLSLWAIFLVGSALALFREHIPLTRSLVLIAALVSAASIPFDLFIPYGALVMPYVVLGLGHYLPRSLNNIGSQHDISYGLYLYGFPVAQLLVAMSRQFWNPWSLAIATIVATACVASASWILIERPFLKGRAVHPSPIEPQAGTTVT